MEKKVREQLILQMIELWEDIIEDPEAPDHVKEKAKEAIELLRSALQGKTSIN